MKFSPSQIPESDSNVDSALLNSNPCSAAKQNQGILIICADKRSSKKNRKVSFSDEPPTVYEYETECEQESAVFFDEGWPGRAREGMKTAGFMDFKSKIEAQLSAINNPLLMSQLESEQNVPSNLLSSSRYKNRKSPLVGSLSFSAQSNSEEESPISPTTESPLITTPSDTMDSWLGPNVNSKTERNSITHAYHQLNDL